MNVDDVVAAKVEAARRRIARERADRLARREARAAGLAQRHAAKLRNLANRQHQAGVATPEPEGDQTMNNASPAEQMTQRIIDAVRKADSAPATPRILSLVHAEPGWVATVYYYEQDKAGGRAVIGGERHRVIGWALVERGGATDLQPVYVESPGFPTCAWLRDSYSPDTVEVYAHYEPDATDLNDPRTDRRGE